MSKIGKNIKKIRNVKGLSQQAFADLFMLTRGNISSYEELRAEPRIEVVVKIANFFGIPLSDFIEKDLSVNELLHYNTALVLETEKLKMVQQLVSIPYVPALYLTEYTERYNDDEFIFTLPNIVVPNNSQFKLLALEIANSESMPAGFDFYNGNIVILEKIVKENYHRITDKLGFMINSEGIKTGIYKEKNSEIYLTLNELVEYHFDFNTDAQYWVLRATYTQDL